MYIMNVSKRIGLILKLPSMWTMTNNKTNIYKLIKCYNCISCYWGYRAYLYVPLGLPQGSVSVLEHVLFILCTAPLSCIICDCGLIYHLHPDNKQLWVLTSASSKLAAGTTIMCCIETIEVVMTVNKLQLN